MRQAHPIPNNLERLSYCFDKFGNLAARKDIKARMEESFTYDGMEVTYTGFDKVSRVRQGGDSLRYVYGFDRERIRMEEFRPEETRTKDYVGSCEFITKTALGESTTRTLTFVSGPCGVFAVVEREGGAERTHYVHKDHLGSWTVITDEDGVVEQTLSYDAWGCLRDPATWANHSAPGDFEPLFGRGFTGHEHLSRFGLVNMDGRMYDPFTASFLSADRFVQDPSSAQGFNRYAYCLHNPLRYVDPTGYYVTYSGHGHDPDGPLKQVIIYGVSGFLIPETTITPDGNPPTTTDWTEFNYEPYFSTGGGGDLHYGCANDSSPTFGPDNGSGGGRNGGKANNNINKNTKPNKDSCLRPQLKLVNTSMFTYDGYVWINSEKLINFDAGQHVQAEIINYNILGVQLSIQDVTTYYISTNSIGLEQIVYSGDNYSTILAPKQGVSYDFYRFDYSPINWTFKVETNISEVVNVRINFYSEWKPGMSLDPNHPRHKKP